MNLTAIEIECVRNGHRGIHLGNDSNVHRSADGFSGFLAGSDDGQTMRQPLQKCMNISGFDHFQELIGGIILQATDSCRGVEECESAILAKGHNLIESETLGLEIHEMIPVAKKHLPLNPPMVIDEIRVIKIHTPTFSLRWEAAQKQHFGILGQERTQRMILHTVFAAPDVICVQIRLHFSSIWGKGTIKIANATQISEI